MAHPTLAEEISGYGNTILVLQGGGALGAYQIGVLEALTEAGIDPDWVIGTSIGAINAALIAGNPPSERVEKMEAFWERVAYDDDFSYTSSFLGLYSRNLMTISTGLPGFFRPNPWAFLSPFAKLPAEQAGYYSTEPLRESLRDLIDFERIKAGETRLAVGAAAVRDSTMHYFDSAETELTLEHIAASGALPPAFPPVRIDGELYWDGGILSNTPIEYVFDHHERRDAMVFAVQLWNPEGEEPEAIWEVMNRQKEMQFSSRVDTHIERQRQIHKLRHIIGELARELPDAALKKNAIKDMSAFGCLTRMQVVRLLAPAILNESHLKDIDFSRDGIAKRRAAGYRDTIECFERAPWRDAFDPNEGLVLHDICEGRVLNAGG